MNKYEKESIPVILSNLQKAYEKQQNFEEAERIAKTAEKYAAKESSKSDLEALKVMLDEDISRIYPDLEKKAADLGDRGAQRALLWGKKVTLIQKSLIDRYLKKGEELIESQSLFVCEACGFIFLGSSAPERCPVCKAPDSRFSKV